MKKVSQKVLFQGEWLAVHECTYENKHGQLVCWESVHRKENLVGVVVVAQLMPSKRFVLIKQFRPAIGGYIISFPAGISKGNPEHALVELKEETGYVGAIQSVSPLMKTHSGVINDSAYIVYAHIDENDPANRNPQQSLEPGEDIQVILASKAEAKKYLLKEYKQGTQIASNLWYLFVLNDQIQC